MSNWQDTMSLNLRVPIQLQVVSSRQNTMSLTEQTRMILLKSINSQNALFLEPWMVSLQLVNSQGTTCPTQQARIAFLEMIDSQSTRSLGNGSVLTRLATLSPKATSKRMTSYCFRNCGRASFVPADCLTSIFARGYH
eukprot:TRINITY_DN65890_c0_g2_i1.p2 TRINITY_DN65890_c0_g2~~TRINITY_DN65890_c0_g2_i1.p2  ORF type:complete len:138 (-),score=16.81 TRINITY_DN65890_c0_g2_i1:27-440(-)